MEDIALRAGVSKITVSRALRDSDAVTPETRERIKQVAQALGYRMNHSARNLRLRKTHTIAVVLEMQPDADRPISDPYPLQLLGGIIQELTTRRYSALLTSLEAVSQDQGLAADGVILLGQGANDIAVRRLQQLGLPMAVWGAVHGIEGKKGGRHVQVGSDNLHGGACVAERFVALQRSEIVFLGDDSHAEVADRLQGFQRVLSKAGLKAQVLKPAAFTFGAGFTVIQSHLSSARRVPDALFAASDLLAMGAVRAFLDAGLRVPQDVSVVGYDNSPAGQTFEPPLSSVHQQWQHGGMLLARKVLDLVAQRPAHSEIMPTSLVVRAT
jgi:DNA-binding LacI/PurR family transcriptional regulator